MTECLRRQHITEMAVGDHMVVPHSRDLYGFPTVYGEDRDGYASLCVDAGLRYEVTSNDGKTLAVREVETGRSVSQQIPSDRTVTVLKVVPRRGKA